MEYLISAYQMLTDKPKGCHNAEKFSLNPLKPLGERGGTRTHDPLIKSQVLYRLSYALPVREYAEG